MNKYYQQIKHLLKQYKIRKYLDQSLDSDDKLNFNTFVDLFLLYEFGETLSYSSFGPQVLNLYLFDLVHASHDRADYLILSKSGLDYLKQIHLDHYFDVIASNLFSNDDYQYHINYSKDQNNTNQQHVHQVYRNLIITTAILSIVWVISIIANSMMHNAFLTVILVLIMSTALITSLTFIYFYDPKPPFNLDKSVSDLKQHQSDFLDLNKSDLRSMWAWLYAHSNAEDKGLFVYVLMQYPNSNYFLERKLLNTKNIIDNQLFSR